MFNEARTLEEMVLDNYVPNDWHFLSRLKTKRSLLLLSGDGCK